MWQKRLDSIFYLHFYVFKVTDLQEGQKYIFTINNSLIFFVYPSPKGSEENQFTPPGVGVNKLIFKRLVVNEVRF